MFFLFTKFLNMYSNVFFFIASKYKHENAYDKSTKLHVRQMYMLFLLLLNANVAIYFFLSALVRFGRCGYIPVHVVPDGYDRNYFPQLLYIA